MLNSYDDYYDAIAKGYDELYGREQLQKLKHIEYCISKYHELNEFMNPGYKLLDVGCGSGISTQYFNVKDRIGIDPSNVLVQIAIDKYPNTKFLVCPAERMPFLKKEFDIVISLTAIQNFYDIEQGLTKIKNAGHRYILAFLKRSDKKGIIEGLIEKNFHVIKRFEEEKDIIYFCK